MNVHVEALKDSAKVLPDGIYLSLDEEIYHADPALGSTSLKSLVDNAPDYWWSSPLNPNREPETETPAKAFGRAVHKCVLEGEDKFRDIYAPVPVPEDYPDCLRTADEIRDFLRERSLSVGGDKKALVARAREVDDCPVIFDKVLEAFEQTGKKSLKREEFTRILAASSFIQANNYLRSAFDGGIPEVSIFWTVDGVRYKARLDYLKMRAITDLKSIRNPLNKPFERACRERVAGLDYTISGAHYMEGRRQMMPMIKRGAVYGIPEGDDKIMPWLIQAAGQKDFAFVLVFWQAEGAPISTGFTLSPENPLLTYARASIARAVHNYRLFMEEFGPDKPWVPSAPLEELQETDMPVWYQQKLIGA